jgi:hypothetical protein
MTFLTRMIRENERGTKLISQKAFEQIPEPGAKKRYCHEASHLRDTGDRAGILFQEGI